MDRPKNLTKVERLELAALEAPILRSATERTLARKVIAYNQETGEERPATGRDVLRGLAKIADLEHVVDEGVRPKDIVCRNCGKMVRVAKAGGIPKVCLGGCGRNCETPGCDGVVGRSTAWKASAAGKPRACLSCGRKRLASIRATMSAEERSEVARKGKAPAGSMARSAAIRKRWAASELARCEAKRIRQETVVERKQARNRQALEAAADAVTMGKARAATKWKVTLRTIHRWVALAADSGGKDSTS